MKGIVSTPDSLTSTKTRRVYPFVFTGEVPSKGNRVPMNIITSSEERDEETGYGYFGARYMDHELMTGWLSVDPMSDKYPSISPYAYCAWNPVRLVDPDGRMSGRRLPQLDKARQMDGF